jgi:hypothetical protein
MHSRPGQSMTFDIDGLQADVMRFMAIIAFCLIAILALAQNVEPPIAESVVEQLPQPVPQVLDVEQAEAPNETLLPPVEKPVELLSNEVKAVPDRVEPPAFDERPLLPEIAPLRLKEKPLRLKEKPLRLKEKPLRLQEKPPHSSENPPHSSENPPHSSEKPPHSSEKPPLALRFVSDDAFIALISAGKIQLYARSDTDYHLMAANFDITQKPPTGVLYDLMPASIPGKISRLFQRTVVADSYLVALPADMQSELNGYLREIAGQDEKDTKDAQGGTLVIHRNGHLSYET